jgi:formylglycine-generating enzyme required for sulfatase activity
VRSNFIHHPGPRGAVFRARVRQYADFRALVQRFDEESDVTIRRALLLSLGEFGEEGLCLEARQALLPKLRSVYRTAADPGLHAAAEWLLRTWQQEAWLKQVNEEWAMDKEQRLKRLASIQLLVAKDQEQTPPQWYVNSQGQTMVVIPGPVEFLMGSPMTELGRWKDQLQHKKRIGRTFAIAAKAVTLEQYRQFHAGYSPGTIELYVRTSNSPVISVSWFQAAAYCNWLSQQEGLPESEWCYEQLQDPKAVPAEKYSGGMKPVRNYLQRTGYRLPTEAEMEYAIRAGSVTSRHFGETEELLPKYAWNAKNSQERTWPVGSLKPNDLGLFDVHGNVWNRCQDRYKDYTQRQGEHPDEDTEEDLTINYEDPRVLRGGSFISHVSFVRSAHRYPVLPAFTSYFIGFRPARTFR